ncbi:MAG: hypothetical protein ABFQ62_02055 [Patescibacteria group bacterium]
MTSPEEIKNSDMAPEGAVFLSRITVAQLYAAFGGSVSYDWLDSQLAEPGDLPKWKIDWLIDKCLSQNNDDRVTETSD